jgi:arylformamidase
MASPVFRDYDQKALDAEYNNRVKVEDALEWIARYGAESARARAELPMRFDVPYGAHHAERLDIFTATTPAPSPVHVFIHGGYWHRMDKADFSFVARGLRPAGAVTVVIDYGLVPSIDLDELVRQCRSSIAWVHRHAGQWGGDPSRISVSGHSAGGHLVAMLLATDWTAFGVPRDVVKAACAISGLYDLEPIRLCYLNEVLALTAEAARRNSPVQLAPSLATPLILALGGAEGPEYHRQTDDLAAAWRGRGVPIEVMDMDGHDHFSIVAELQSPVSPLARAIQRQMGLA